MEDSQSDERPDPSGQPPNKRRKTDVGLTASASSSLAHDNPAARAAKPTTALAPTGDVVLVLQDQSQIRVHSVVLKLASPVFRAMFGPHFSEGQNLSETNPKNVPLPDDPPEAMTIICELLHHHKPQRPVPSGNLLSDIVNSVDKYDLAGALELTMREFLFQNLEIAKKNQFKSAADQELLKMAYILRDGKAFSIISQELLMLYSGDFSSLSLSTIDDASYCATLEAKRAEAYKELDTTIITTITIWLKELQSLSPRYTSDYGSPEECARKLLIGFFANEEDILNYEKCIDEEKSLFYCFNYWANPFYEVSTQHPGDKYIKRWSEWLMDLELCNECRSSTKPIEDLSRVVHVAMEGVRCKISGLSLD